MNQLKWAEKDVVEEYKYQDETIPVNLAKIRQFQRHTDDLEECVMWAINSHHNDADERHRRLSHGTGAV